MDSCEYQKDGINQSPEKKEISEGKELIMNMHIYQNNKFELLVHDFLRTTRNQAISPTFISFIISTSPM